MPRLGYTKTRTGCLKCRQRRVKCDEKRPCTACSRHGVPCSLVENASSGSEGPSRPPQTESVGAEPNLFAAFVPPEGPLFTGPASEGTVALGDWALDMELMHHYTSTAYLTLPRVDEIGSVWQHTAVEQAMSYGYLLHHILAFSALHLAYLRPESRERYSLAAAQHQRRGIPPMSAALAHLSADNCHSLFLAACFLAIGSFAASTVRVGFGPGDQLATIDEIVDAFNLLRGMNVVLTIWESAIQEGPCARLFDPSTPSGGLVVPPFWDEIDLQLGRQRAVLQDGLLDDPATAALIDGEILILSNALRQTRDSSSIPELRFVMYWPMQTSDGFVRLLRDKNPAALVVLCYYCVVVYATESTTWYTRGWANKVVHAVETLLPPTWLGMIQWPLERLQGGYV